MARKGTFDYSLFIIPALVLGILVLLQVLSYRFSTRVDLTPQRLHSLSEKSRNVLASLDGSALSATAFYTEDDFFRERARDLLEEYRSAYRGFEYRIVDPARNPALVERHEVGSNGTIVLEYRGRETKIVSREEEAITNGIYRLATDRRRVVYFLTGHGEKTPTGDYSRLAAALEGELYEPRELLLLREDRVPEDAACVVVAGPRQALAEHEVRRLADYYRDGGSLLVMLDPYRNGGLEPFLAALGIRLSLDTIVDERSRLMGGDFLFPIVSDYGNHSITRSLDLVTFYPIARSLSLDRNPPEGVDLRVLAQTGSDAWAEMDYDALSRGEARFDPAEDVSGPLTIAVAATRRDPETGADGRMVVYGDSDFAGNEYIEVSGNRDIILNTFAWLTSEPDLIGIRSRDPDHTPVILTGTETRVVFWLTIVLLPALAIAAGIAVFLLVRWKQ